MDYSRPELADRLAAEYVLGTLRGPARRRFENLLPAHPALRHATGGWENRLAQLSSTALAVPPSPRVWAGVERRLFGEVNAVAGGQRLAPWWQRLGLWQGATAMATVAAISLGVLLAQPPATLPPTVILMSAQAGAPGGLQAASFVASVGGDGRSLVLKPLNEGQQLALNQALELWAVPAQGSPRSLGLVSARQTTTVIRASLLKDTAAFAVTVEPTGGSPSGAPTGPVISMGKLQL